MSIISSEIEVGCVGTKSFPRYVYKYCFIKIATYSIHVSIFRKEIEVGREGHFFCTVYIYNDMITVYIFE